MLSVNGKNCHITQTIDVELKKKSYKINETW